MFNLGPIAATAVLFALLAGATAREPSQVAAGDVVFTAIPDAEFRLEDNSVVKLEDGARIEVGEIAEGRVTGFAVGGGERKPGWIESSLVFMNDDPTSVAAFAKLGVEMAKNRHGNTWRLSVEESEFTSEDLAHLKGLHSLEGLELSGAKITNEDLAKISGLTGLRWLYLDETTIDDDGLLALRGLVNLEVLVLSNSNVKGPGLAHISHLTKLLVLNLSDCEINDDALEHLSGLQEVQTIALKGTPISGGGLKHLGKLPRLTVLTLDNCKVRGGALMELQTAERLRIIYADEAEIPQEDEDALKALNPRLSIFH